MTKEEAKKIYDKLFADPNDKAEAFDKLAELYFYSNFGTASKTEIDILMFSLYLEQILNSSPDDFTTYSDYTLSKQLGITQSKVCNMKVKKELIYPYEDFDWKKMLLAVSKNVIVEDQRIKLYIPDRNVYLEIKNAVESNGGFVDVTLTGNLLVLRQAYFLDLLVAISENIDKKTIKKELADILKKNADITIAETDAIGKALLNQTPKLIIDLLGECIPVFGGVIKCIGENVLEAIKKDSEVS